MTAFAMDVRELTFEEIDFVSGGGFWADVWDGIKNVATWIVENVQIALNFDQDGNITGGTATIG